MFAIKKVLVIFHKLHHGRLMKFFLILLRLFLAA